MLVATLAPRQVRICSIQPLRIRYQCIAIDFQAI